MNFFYSIWTEFSLPLCVTVPSHFTVHTSLFSTHLFLPDTVKWEQVHVLMNVSRNLDFLMDIFPVADSFSVFVPVWNIVTD